MENGNLIFISIVAALICTSIVDLLAAELTALRAKLYMFCVINICAGC